MALATQEMSGQHGESFAIRKLETKLGRSIGALRTIAVEENVFQTQAWPMNRTCFLWELDCPTLHAPAEPVEKLLFLAFDQHRIASDSKRLDDGLVRGKFSGKPIRPFRHSRNSVDMSQRGPHEAAVRAPQNSAPRTHR